MHPRCLVAVTLAAAIAGSGCLSGALIGGEEDRRRGALVGAGIEVVAIGGLTAVGATYEPEDPSEERVSFGRSLLIATLATVTVDALFAAICYVMIEDVGQD